MGRSLRGFPALIALLVLSAVHAEAAGLLVPRDGSKPIEVRSHRVNAVVQDGLARTTLRQTFVNPHRRELEAIYVFPVPEGAALVEVAMETGGKRFEGLLAERQRARRIYDDIVRQKKDPALVEQIGRSTFRLSVYPVLPGRKTVVELTWVQHIPLTQELLRYVYPLSLVTDSATRTRHDFTFSVTLRSTVPFGAGPPEGSLPKGTEVIRKGPREIVASFEKSRVRLEQDVIVQALVSVEEPTLTVSSYRGKTGDGWFMVVVTPPKAEVRDLIPRDVILLLDTSGSMRGDKMEQAKKAALYLLSHLRPGDRVNVFRFSTSMEAFAEEPVPASLESISKLTAFVNGLEAGGGTALGDAIRGLRRLPEAEGRVRTVVLITDGLPTVGETDPAKIVGFAKEAGAKGLRVFTFGVGRDVDPGLLRGVSRASRGRAEVFKPEEQLEARLRAFLDRTASPVVADLKLKVENLEVYDVLPRPVPDVYLGEQVALVGRYRNGGEREVAVAAIVGRRRARLAKKVVFRRSEGGSPAVAQLFAVEHLRFLEEALRLRLGLSDDAYYAALDRGAYSTKDEIVTEMIRVSLDHGVQCAYTSFLVLLPEDRHRLDPRSAAEIAVALDRARQARRGLSLGGREPPGDSGGDAGGAEAGEFLDEVESEKEEGGIPIVPGSGVVAPGHGKGAIPAPNPGARPPAASGPVADPKTDDPKAEPPKPGFYGLRALRSEFGKRGLLRTTEPAVDRALDWLVRNQKEDGRWSAGNDDKYDVGVTGLALLALLGAGEEPAGTKRAPTVVKGLAWLLAQQDGEGCFGMRGPKITNYVYNHAIATRAVAEAYGLSRSIFLEHSAQKGIDFIHRCQNPYLAWRYGVRPQDNDTSVTTWMVLALKCGKEAGLRVDPTGFEGARAWLEKATEPEYGRTGYTARGTGPARPQDLMDRFPSDKSEALTAAAMLCRVFIGEDPRKSEMVMKGAELLLKALPLWDDLGGSIDMYYWYFGTLAMFQVGGDPWKRWRKSVTEVILANQHQGGDLDGSWAPIGPWGRDGGRVYATALLAMCLEAEYLYPRIFERHTWRKRGRNR